MAEQKFIMYGDKKMPMGNLTLEQAKATMARFFPELADPKIETKKHGDETVYVFTKQAGRKGAAPRKRVGARSSRPTRQRRKVRLTAHARIVRNLRAVKPAPVIAPDALAFAAGKATHSSHQSEQFLRDEIAATAHARSELAALEPLLPNGGIL